MTIDTTHLDGSFQPLTACCSTDEEISAADRHCASALFAAGFRRPAEAAVRAEGQAWDTWFSAELGATARIAVDVDGRPASQTRGGVYGVELSKCDPDMARVRARILAQYGTVEVSS